MRHDHVLFLVGIGCQGQAVLQVQAGLGALVRLQAGKHWKPEKWNYVVLWNSIEVMSDLEFNIQPEINLTHFSKCPSYLNPNCSK